MPLSKKHRKASIQPKLDGNIITFTVRGPSADGEKPGEIVGITSLDLDKVHQSHHRSAEVHGWIQRIGDSAALSSDPKTGLAPTATDKLSAMAKLVDHYNSGSAEWSPTRSRAIGSDEILLARVLAEVYSDRTPERIREYVAGLRVAERNAILTKFKEIADRMRGEASADVDAEALLKDL